MHEPTISCLLINSRISQSAKRYISVLCQTMLKVKLNWHIGLQALVNARVGSGRSADSLTGGQFGAGGTSDNGESDNK